ncbi:hypothetical protein FSP39_015586 [Pinctada imbricata]|uniref:Rapamycin-insensitive companion of mTOR n=1 Tax=Pinctada imbricata TaxID=66713 RepID=A0AA88XRC7_PINIB|nr:hypothetical protein FSP39_015586 [Pinctada imbricata]
MATPVGRLGVRSFRSGRFRGRCESGDEGPKVDFTRDPKDILKDILTNAVSQTHSTKSKKLTYLNAFVKFIVKLGHTSTEGITRQEILCCLRVCLFHEAKEVRAATLRALRYFVQDEETLDLLYNLHIDYLIVRSIDLCLDNEVERIHAIKLVRKIAQVAPSRLSPLLLYPLVAIGNDGANERDRMVRISLATICEIAFLNPEMLASCGGIGAILHAAIACHQYPRINESLVSTILHLLNHPKTRHLIQFNTDLEQLLAPFTDCHFKFNVESTDHSSREDRENRFEASKMAIISVMRSWPGIVRFCRPDGSGLQSLVGILYLPYEEIRQGILEMMFDLFRLKLPEWTDNFNTALLSVDPSEMQENWKLTDGFVAEEGKCLLPHMAKIRPNLVENHLALLLSAWLEAGILDALVEVMISSDDHLYVRATILLGEILHLASTLLPHECNHHSHCLPSLMVLASSPDLSSSQRHQATLAVYLLDRFHSIKKRGPVPCSMYLDQLIQRNGGRNVGQTRFHLRKTYDICITKSPSEDMIGQAIRESQVLVTKDNLKWEWDLIIAILKWPEEKYKRLDDQNFSRFIKRIVFFFKPTNHKFSRLEINHEFVINMCHAGCLMVDYLLESDQEEAYKYMTDFLMDVGECLSEISRQCLAPESVFSPANVINTCSQYYFLFTGRFSGSAKGDKYLEKAGIFQYLLEIMATTSQDSFIKLIVSSLNYSKEGNARAILSKALSATAESARLYCTKFMRVLLRAKVAGFSSWGVELLVNQLYDQSIQVAQAALAVLDEACDVEACLHSLIKLRPSCLHLGEKGVLLVCRFLSIPKGFKLLFDANYTNNEFHKWATSFNRRYVFIVEELLNEALTTYEKTYEGAFTRRSSRKRAKKDAFLPVHLYGQLSQHKDGFDLLQQQECLEDYFQCIKCQNLHSSDDIVKMKEALWVVGHIGTSTWGVNWLEEKDLLPEVIKLAEECGVFSVRGTAFFVLGLLASTREGAEYLNQLGWESCWHTREDRWPVVENRSEMLHDLDDILSDTFSLRSSDYEPRALNSPSVRSSSTLFFIAEEDKNSHGSNGCDSSQVQTCDKNSNLQTLPSRRSKTLPLETLGYKRYKTLPTRSTAFSFSIGEKGRKSKDDHFQKRGRKDFQQVESGNVVLEIPNVPKEEQDLDSSYEVGENVVSSENLTVPVIYLTKTDSNNVEDVAKETTSEKLIQIQEQQVCDTCANDDTTDGDVSFSIGSSSASITKHEDGDSKRVSEHYVKKSPVLKEVRSSSSDSSRTSNKSRTDSFNTDSTTSGISSCESGPNQCLSSDVVSLSPIASTSSVETVGVTMTTTESKDLVHPSSFRRKSLNLNRVPSLRIKQSSPAYGILPSARLLEGAQTENAVMFTTTRDAAGYDTWRSIMRQRRVSSDVESDLGIGTLYGEEDPVEVPMRRPSIDSKVSTETFTFRLSSGMPRNASGVSLSDMDRPMSPFGVAPKAILQQRKPHTGNAEFIGLALPVDINMVFEVHEGEDKRSHSSHTVLSKRDSSPDFKKPQSRSRKVSRSTSYSMSSDQFDHDRSICLVCHRLQYGQDNFAVAEEGEGGESDYVMEQDGSGAPFGTRGLTRSRVDSVNEYSSATPGSVTSCTSTEAPQTRMSYESVHGKVLIRKELRNMVINLSSSVGVKGSEQGLLSLKQKFPLVFKDVCFYSEVCEIMSSCSFRLTARRFIQELFEEFDIKKLLEEPYSLLGITASVEKSSPSKSENLDSLSENKF